MVCCQTRKSQRRLYVGFHNHIDKYKRHRPQNRSFTLKNRSL